MLTRRDVRVHNSVMSPEAEPTATQTKQALRRELRARRRSLLPQRDRGTDGDAIAAAATALLDTISAPVTPAGEHPRYHRPWCVAIYRSLPHEPPTQALATVLQARRTRVIVPETLPDLDLEWRELYADGSEGPRLGLDGIAGAQLILTPALAVDHHGTRLGQGGGCYDRALARRSPEAVIVAIVNNEEYGGPRLPQDAHDVSVQGVITPGGYSPIPPPGSVA